MIFVNQSEKIEIRLTANHVQSAEILIDETGGYKIMNYIERKGNRLSNCGFHETPKSL